MRGHRPEGVANLLSCGGEGRVASRTCTCQDPDVMLAENRLSGKRCGQVKPGRARELSPGVGVPFPPRWRAVHAAEVSLRPPGPPTPCGRGSRPSAAGTRRPVRVRRARTVNCFSTLTPSAWPRSCAARWSGGRVGPPGRTGCDAEPGAGPARVPSVAPWNAVSRSWEEWQEIASSVRAASKVGRNWFVDRLFTSAMRTVPTRGSPRGPPFYWVGCPRRNGPSHSGR